MNLRRDSTSTDMDMDLPLLFTHHLVIYETPPLTPCLLLTQTRGGVEAEVIFEWLKPARRGRVRPDPITDRLTARRSDGMVSC